MLGWFVGGMMRREAIRTIGAAKKMPYDVQISIACNVLEMMSFIDNLKGQGRVAVSEALQSVARQATEDRHMALKRGANSNADPAWNAAALVESWALAYLAQLQGRVSVKIFKSIDAVLWGFISDNLPPEQIAKILGLTGERRK